MSLLHHSYEPEKNKLTYQHFPLTTGPINKSLIANFSGKETSFFFKILPKVVFCTIVPEYGHNSICQKTDLTTFVSQVFKSSSGLLFTAKILQKAMYLAFPYPGQISYKI